MSELVLGRIENGVAIVTLNRPEASNAMSMALGNALFAVVERFARDPAVRAWLLAANGKNFCAGGDIAAFGNTDDPQGLIRAMANRLHDSLKLLAAHRAPVVTAIQGAAAGAGFGIATGADIAIAARSASFVWAYGAIGLTVDGGASWTLPRLVGVRRAREIALTGRRIGAEEAVAIGLVTRVVEDDVLQHEALATARAIAAGPTESFAAVSRLFDDSEQRGYAAHLDAEAEGIAAALGRADGANAVAAFLAKRKPEFAGE